MTSSFGEILSEGEIQSTMFAHSHKKILRCYFPPANHVHCPTTVLHLWKNSFYDILPIWNHRRKKKVFLSTSQLKRFSRSLDTKKMLRKYVIKKYTIKGVIESSQQRRITPQYIYLLFGYFSLGKTSLICFTR